MRVADVEEITQRAGSFKKFAVFLQMLRSALEEGGSSVSLDILTYADLQALKRRKAGQTESGAASAGSVNNKRYIIVTYESQFDRVHYPLPLAPATRRQAQAEGQHALPASAGRAASQQQQEQLRQEKEELQSAYERLQRDSSREVSRLRKECDGLARQLGEQAEQVSALRDELLAHGGNARVVEKLRAKLQELERHAEEERTDFHRALSKHKKEVAHPPEHTARPAAAACTPRAAALHPLPPHLHPLPPHLHHPGRRAAPPAGTLHHPAATLLLTTSPPRRGR